MHRNLFLGVWILFSALLMNFSSARAEDWRVTGPETKGGEVEIFLRKIDYVRQNNIRLVLVKKCRSSCTLYASLVKDGLVCATPRTLLYFHRFMWATDIVSVGGILQSYKLEPLPAGLAQRIWMKYPLHIRRAILAAGGLPPVGKWLKISAVDLGIPTC